MIGVAAIAEIIPHARGATTMPDMTTLARVRRDKREGKSKSTQAGEFVREEIEHVREGKHGARSARQAIAIGLSKARKAGIDVPRKGASKKKTSAPRKRAAAAKRGGPSAKRSAATKKALRREGHSAASRKSLSRQARSAASKRSAASRSAAARKAARTKGARGRSAAARKAARTRARRKR
jgi:hypothetical protein